MRSSLLYIGILLIFVECQNARSVESPVPSLIASATTAPVMYYLTIPFINHDHIQHLNMTRLELLRAAPEQNLFYSTVMDPSSTR